MPPGVQPSSGVPADMVGVGDLEAAVQVGLAGHLDEGDGRPPVRARSLAHTFDCRREGGQVAFSGSAKQRAPLTTGTTVWEVSLRWMPSKTDFERWCMGAVDLYAPWELVESIFEVLSGVGRERTRLPTRPGSTASGTRRRR
jgi:hypothetical protein